MSSTRKKKAQAITPAPAGKGTLFVVATPIGNMEDITLRALRILKEVDLIAAEDTRHTKKLLTHFGITTPTLSYYKEKEQERTSVIIDKLRNGISVALVSDAGTPGISDPGSILVRRAQEENIKIEASAPQFASITANIKIKAKYKSNLHIADLKNDAIQFFSDDDFQNPNVMNLPNGTKLSMPYGFAYVPFAIIFKEAYLLIDSSSDQIVIYAQDKVQKTITPKNVKGLYSVAVHPSLMR